MFTQFYVDYDDPEGNHHNSDKMGKGKMIWMISIIKENCAIASNQETSPENSNFLINIPFVDQYKWTENKSSNFMELTVGIYFPRSNFK